MRFLILIFLLVMWATNSFAREVSMNEIRNIMFSPYVIAIFTGIVSVIVGYVIGTMKSFREAKQKAYGELLPPIIKTAYNPQGDDEKEFNAAINKLWLYGSKSVALKMEHALKIMHDPSKGDVTKALQEAVVEMRKDIQLWLLWPWQKLNPKDVNHIYTIIAKGKDTE